jgi:hypothetical protein
MLNERKCGWWLVLAILCGACASEGNDSVGLGDTATTPDSTHEPEPVPSDTDQEPGDAVVEGGVVDGGPECASPFSWRYAQAGCDRAPVCASPWGDACYREVCGCDGVTYGGCDNFEQPFEHNGPCIDSGMLDASDAG